MEAPPEFGITAILVGTAGVVTGIQLVAALGHCWNAQVHLGEEREENATFRPRTSGNLARELGEPVLKFLIHFQIN